MGTLALDRVNVLDWSRDPAFDRVCAMLEQRGGLDEGETAGFFRFWMQREGYLELGPVQLFIAVQFVRYYLSTRGLAFSSIESRRRASAARRRRVSSSVRALRRPSVDGATSRRGAERRVLEHAGLVLDQLDAAVEGPVLDHFEGDVRVAVVDAFCAPWPR